MSRVHLVAHSVGEGGRNAAADVRAVQHLLNDWLGRKNARLLAVDGVAGPLTIGAIRDAQRAFGGVVDGRVDPAGPTINWLFRNFMDAMLGGVKLPLERPPPGTAGEMPNAAEIDAAFAAFAAALRRSRG